MEMKCYLCGQEASVAVREQAMVRTLETTKFYCRDCYDRGLKRAPSEVSTNESGEGHSIPTDRIISCPRCGTKNLRTDNRCRECETDLSETKKRLIDAKKDR